MSVRLGVFVPVFVCLPIKFNNSICSSFPLGPLTIGVNRPTYQRAHACLVISSITIKWESYCCLLLLHVCPRGRQIGLTGCPLVPRAEESSDLSAKVERPFTSRLLRRQSDCHELQGLRELNALSNELTQSTVLSAYALLLGRKQHARAWKSTRVFSRCACVFSSRSFSTNENSFMAE